MPCERLMRCFGQLRLVSGAKSVLFFSLWSTNAWIMRSNGFCQWRADTNAATPLGLCCPRRIATQGSSFLATLGFETESLRDSRIVTIDSQILTRFVFSLTAIEPTSQHIELWQ